MSVQVVTPYELWAASRAEREEIQNFCVLYGVNPDDVCGVAIGNEPMLAATITFTLWERDAEGNVRARLGKAVSHQEQRQLIGEPPDWFVKYAQEVK